MQKDLNKALNLFQNGRLEEAKNICLEVLKKNNYNSQALNLNAFILYYQKNFEEAIEHWEKAININPNYIEAYNNLRLLFLIH